MKAFPIYPRDFSINFSFEIDNIDKLIKNWEINRIERVLVIPSVNRAPIALKNRNNKKI